MTAGSPMPCSPSHPDTFAIDAGLGSPSNGPEWTITPSWSYASVIDAASRSSPGGWIATRTSSPCSRANSKSRWSCAGTPITAPVPYSIKTYGATKTGTRSPFTGFTTWTPSRTPSRLSACSRFVRGVDWSRSTIVRAASDVPPASASVDTSGCSGAKTKNVTPHSVSGRVVNTSTSSPVSSTRNRTVAPSERPIQFRWA